MEVEYGFDDVREIKKNIITRRFGLNAGFACNARCKFCYYQESIKTGKTCDKNTHEVKRLLRLGRAWHKTRVDFTGGEPTVRNDLPELIAYARSIGYETACIITNGITCGKKNGYLQRLIDSGLNDVLISIHGACAQTHDSLTQVGGSFGSALKTAELVACRTDVDLRFNYVVCQENFTEVVTAAGLIAGFKPDALNLILFHPVAQASSSEEKVKFRNYLDVTCLVKEAIDSVTTVIRHINVRDVPYCLMKGYERYLKPLLQIQYEKAEWDFCIDILIKKGRFFYFCALLFGTVLSVTNPYFWKADIDNKKHLAMQIARGYRMRKKGGQCRLCSVRFICDGLAREYVAQKGTAELVPYTGAIITNPTYFMPEDDLEIG